MKYARTAFLFFSLVISGRALADDAARVEAGKLLDAINMQTALDQAIKVMLNEQIKQNATLAPYKQVMLGFFAKYMSYTALKPELTAIYASEFSAAELKELRAFYSTPTGKKSVAKMPVLMGKGAEMGVKSVQDHLPELQQMISEESQRIQKLQQDANPAESIESTPEQN